MSGEHEKIFVIVAEIYEDAKIAHEIIGRIPAILVEDETNIRSKVFYEQCFDILDEFCRSKDNRMYVSNYEPIVGVE